MENTVQDIAASELIGEFFRQYCSCTTATKNIEIDKSVSVYPDPAQQSFTIEVKDEYIDFLMMNSSGVVVRKEVHFFGKDTIDSGEMPGGVYFLTVVTIGKVFVKKIFLQ